MIAAPDDPGSADGFTWCVLQVSVDAESGVRETLLRRVQIEQLAHLIGRVVVLMARGHSPRSPFIEGPVFPGRVFVEVRLDPDGQVPEPIQHLLRQVPRVGDFVGTAGRPTPMKEHEIEKLHLDSRKPDDEPTIKLVFSKGEHVLIKEGPFQNYEGTVDELVPEKGLVRVLVTIFGRQAPIELEEWQLGKAEGT